MDQYVALLRGVNVGGHRKVPMAALRELASGLGWQDAQSYVQSGNLVFRARGTAVTLERALEAAIETHFGFAVPVIVRAGRTWLAYAKGSAFPDAETDRPNLLHLALPKHKPAPDAATALLPYCKADERIAIRGDAIWVDFLSGVARSKLTSAVLDRLVGSTVTARNWKTVQAIAALLQSAAFTNSRKS